MGLDPKPANSAGRGVQSPPLHAPPGLSGQSSVTHRSKPISVCGARAPSFVGCRLWDSLFKQLLSRSSPLRSFFYSMRSRVAPIQAAENSSCVWPMPLPFPAVLAPKAGLDSHSSDQLGLNLIALVLSFLHCNGPSVAPLKICSGAKPTSQQWAALGTFRAAVQAWNSYP